MSPARKPHIIHVTGSPAAPKKRRKAQPDVLTDLRRSCDWAAFDELVQQVGQEQPETLPLLQKAFGRTLQASWITSHLLAPTHQANLPRPSPSSLFMEREDLEAAFPEEGRFFVERELPATSLVDLTRDVVVTWPWAPERTLQTLKVTGADRGNPWTYDENNHLVVGYRYFGVFFCVNGFHSTMNGILKQEGQVPVTQAGDPTFLLEHVQVSEDGRHYLNASTLQEIGKVKNLEFAALFRLAQERRRQGLDGL